MRIWRFAWKRFEDLHPEACWEKDFFFASINNSIGDPLHIQTGAEASPAPSRLSRPLSEASRNASDLHDPTAQHLGSPTAPAIVTHSQGTKRGKRDGKKLTTPAVSNLCREPVARLVALQSGCVIQKHARNSPRHEGGNLCKSEDFEGKRWGNLELHSAVLSVLPVRIVTWILKLLLQNTTISLRVTKIKLKDPKL